LQAGSLIGQGVGHPVRDHYIAPAGRYRKVLGNTFTELDNVVCAREGQVVCLRLAEAALVYYSLEQ